MASDRPQDLPGPLPALVRRLDGRWRLVFVPQVGRHMLRRAAVAFVLPFGAALPVLLIVSGVARFTAGTATRWRITLQILVVLAIIGVALVIVALFRQLSMARWIDLPDDLDREGGEAAFRRIAGQGRLAISDLRRVVVTEQARLGGQTGLRVLFDAAGEPVIGALVTYRAGVGAALAGWLTGRFAGTGVEIHYEPTDDRPGVLRFL